MENVLEARCECSGWCHVEQYDLRDIHHKLCPKHAEVDLKEVLVWRVSHQGNSFCDQELEGLFSLIEEMAPGDEYTVSRESMRERDFKALPEFDGF